jgi:hypothetical protein
LGRVGLGMRSCVGFAGVRFAELGTRFGTRSQAQARSNTTFYLATEERPFAATSAAATEASRGSRPELLPGCTQPMASRVTAADPARTIVLNPKRPREVLPLMPYPSGERGATVAAEVRHTKRAQRDVARLCATGRVMLTAMPTDPATEAVEHVNNLACERREVFDPAELIVDLARIGEPRFATLLGDGPLVRHRAGSRPDGDTPGTALGRRRRGPTAAAPRPRVPRHRPSLGGSPHLRPPGGGGCEQLQQQRRI